jgi:hypothetical protein
LRLKRRNALSRDSPSFKMTSANRDTPLHDERIHYSPAARLSSFFTVDSP